MGKQSKLATSIFSLRSDAHNEIEREKVQARDLVGQISTDIVGAATTIRSLARKLPLNNSMQEPLRITLTSDDISATLKPVALAELSAKANLFFDELQSVVENQKLKAQENFQQAKKSYSAMLKGITLFAFILGVIASSIVWLSGINENLGTIASITLTGILGLVSSAIGRKIFSAVKKAPDKDSFPSGKQAVRAAYIASKDKTKIEISTAEVRKALDAVDFEPISLAIPPLFSETQNALDEIAVQINKAGQRLDSCFNQYSKSYHEWAASIKTWYEPSDKKALLTDGMSKRIKEKSIEPSFEVLRQKQETVSSTVAKIRDAEILFE